MDEENDIRKAHIKRHAGKKAERKAEKTKHVQEYTDRQRNPKAFTFKSAVKAREQFLRTQNLQHRKHHIPVVSRTPLEPPPVLVAIVGGPRAGKSTLMRSLIKCYTKQRLTVIAGPVTVVTGKSRRITLVEVNNDLNCMVDVAKVADIVLCLIDVTFGIEMEVFEFLEICRAHGKPNILGILNHIDLMKENKSLKKKKKALKNRFQVELHPNAKLFYLTGQIRDEYMVHEIKFISRYIANSKFRPLEWRCTHPYVYVDRWEDLTSPGVVQATPTADREVVLYGYVRGTSLHPGQQVHIPGCGDFQLDDIHFLPDPCPLPNHEKKRSLFTEEQLLYAPFSAVGGVLYDKDAVYVDLGGSQHGRHIMEQRKQEEAIMSKALKSNDGDKDENNEDDGTEEEVDEEKKEAVTIMSGLQSLKKPVDKIQLFAGGKVIASHYNNTELGISSTHSGSGDAGGRIRRKAPTRFWREGERDESEDSDGSGEENNDMAEDDEDSSSDDDDDDEDSEGSEDSDDSEEEDGESVSEMREEITSYDATEPVNKKRKLTEQSYKSSSTEVTVHKAVPIRSLHSDGNDVLSKIQNALLSIQQAKIDEQTADASNSQGGSSDVDDHGYNSCEEDNSGVGGSSTNEKDKDKVVSKTSTNSTSFASAKDTNDTSFRRSKKTKIQSVEEKETEGIQKSWLKQALGDHYKPEDFDNEKQQELEDDEEFQRAVFEEAREAYYKNRTSITFLMDHIYGDGKPEEASVVTTSKKDDDDDGDFLRPKTVTTNVFDEQDTSCWSTPHLDDWRRDEVKDTIRDCFVTGTWKKSEDAETLLKIEDDDEELYGDFEDLETGEKFGGKEEDKEDKEEEEEGGSTDPVAPVPSGRDAAKDSRREKIYAKKRKLKAMLETQFGDEDKDKSDHFNNWKDVMNQQALLNRSEFETLSDEVRVLYEGFRAGMYVRMHFKQMPCEFVLNFDPTYPIIVGGLLDNETKNVYNRVRMKVHRWYPKILKNRDPIIISAGWRRFQTMMFYGKREDDLKLRSLKYAKKYLHVEAIFWGPYIPSRAGFVAFQTLGNTMKSFRIAANGVLLEADKSTKLVKKLKLIGHPKSIEQKTAYVKDMFHSETEVAKFVGAKIQTQSGIRGMIKISSGLHGDFRAKFEDKIKISDVIILKTWAPVQVTQYCTFVRSLLLSPEEKADWQGMKTVAQIKRDNNIRHKADKDSLYTKIYRRRTYVPKPLNVPKSLQAALPYKYKPKHETEVEPSKRVLIVKDPHEEKMDRFMGRVRLLMADKEQKDKAKKDAKKALYKKEYQEKEAFRSNREKNRKQAACKKFNLKNRNKPK